MKSKLFMFLCGMLVCFIFACSDEEQEQQAPPKETPQVVKDVVEALEETVPQASDFIDVLKQADLADVTAEKLTVFAVRNETTTRANAELDTVSVKRHIVVGNYKKDDLTDGQELTCVSGDKLLVSKINDEVSVNGVIIIGKAISAGDSYIYIVPEVIPGRGEAPTLHETTFKVWNLLAYNYQEEKEPLAEVTIKVFNNFRDSLGNYVTNSLGEVVISHASDTIFYQLEKDGFQMYVDYNGDGVATSDELKEGESVLVYDGNNNKMTQECFMKETKDQEQVMKVGEAQEQWNLQMQNFYSQNRALNQRLAYGYGGFSFEYVEYASEAYWKDAYRAIDLGLQLQKAAVNATVDMELWNALSLSIKIDMGLIYSDVLGYYGQLIFKNSLDSEPTPDVNALYAYLDELIALGNGGKFKGASQAIVARVRLNQKDYQRVYRECKSIVESGNYSLSAEDVFATADNKAVVWGGYNETDSIFQLGKGLYFHPIRYVEVLLMTAEAANEIGMREEAIAYLNQIVISKGQTAIAPLDATVEDIRGYIRQLFEQELRNEGLEYATWRRWEVIASKLKDIPGYKAHNSFLPIPQEALNEYPSLTQNAGY